MGWRRKVNPVTLYPGKYQFTDPSMATNTTWFYILCQP